MWSLTGDPRAAVTVLAHHIRQVLRIAEAAVLGFLKQADDVLQQHRQGLARPNVRQSVLERKPSLPLLPDDSRRGSDHRHARDESLGTAAGRAMEVFGPRTGAPKYNNIRYYTILYIYYDIHIH